LSKPIYIIENLGSYLVAWYIAIKWYWYIRCN